MEGIPCALVAIVTFTRFFLSRTGNLTAAGGVINRTETSVLHINDSITNVNLILTGDGNVANITGGEGLATISNDVISDISNGKDALESAGSLTSESTADIEA